MTARGIRIRYQGAYGSRSGASLCSGCVVSVSVCVAGGASRCSGIHVAVAV